VRARGQGPSRRLASAPITTSGAAATSIAVRTGVGTDQTVTAVPTTITAISSAAPSAAVRTGRRGDLTVSAYPLPPAISPAG